MDLEQLEKRVNWLDGERRKDQDTIAKLDQQLQALGVKLAAAEIKNKELAGEITRLSTVVGRMDAFDGSLVQHRTEFNAMLKNVEQKSEQTNDETTRLLRAEIRAFENSLIEMRRTLEVLPNMRAELSTRAQEDIRLGKLIDELETTTEDLQRSEEEQSRIYRLLEDGRRQDVKRMTDLQGEISALRKRADEQRGRIDVNETNQKKIETRLNELLAVEVERRDAQSTFLEKQTLAEVERERIWKDWQSRFDVLEKQSVDLESQLQLLDTTHLTIKRIQSGVDDLMQRVERRINEIVEMQRLAEERFRQEWTTFKADDQKRWTNYTLSQEEQRSESGRRFDRIVDQVTNLEDSLQEVQDTLYQVNELTNKRLLFLLSAAHDWVNEYERVQGSTR
jgi:chromosome segregation ATPase